MLFGTYTGIRNLYNASPREAIDVIEVIDRGPRLVHIRTQRVNGACPFGTYIINLKICVPRGDCVYTHCHV